MRYHAVSDNALPIPMSRMASVPYGDTFLLVGGYRPLALTYMDTIYEFDTLGETFKLRNDVSLRRARSDHVAFFVDALAFPDCDGK